MLTDQAQEEYHQRNESLKKLGFSSYKVYLVSELWKCIRREVLLPNTRCRACGKKATTLHHARYTVDDLNGKCLEYLIPVCHGCHHRAEITKKGNKVGPTQATATLKQWGKKQEKSQEKQDKHKEKQAVWSYFFATITEVRIYMGMDPTEEARLLTHKLDEALTAVREQRKSQGMQKKRRSKKQRTSLQAS